MRTLQQHSSGPVGGSSTGAGIGAKVRRHARGRRTLGPCAHLILRPVRCRVKDPRRCRCPDQRSELLDSPLAWSYHQRTTILGPTDTRGVRVSSHRSESSSGSPPGRPLDTDRQRCHRPRTAGTGTIDRRQLRRPPDGRHRRRPRPTGNRLGKDRTDHLSARGLGHLRDLYCGSCDLYPATHPRSPARSGSTRTGSRSIARILQPR
jgi:hypothetical protein